MYVQDQNLLPYLKTHYLITDLLEFMLYILKIIIHLPIICRSTAQNIFCVQMHEHIYVYNFLTILQITSQFLNAFLLKRIN